MAGESAPERRARRPQEIAEGVGVHLRARREEQGVSLRELARRLSISPSALSQIETGKSRPSVSTLYAIVSELRMIIRAPGYRTVATHVFDAASEYLDSDAVFAVKPSLLREFAARAADDPERPAGVDGEWFSVENDLVLVPSADPGEPTDPGRTA